MNEKMKSRPSGAKVHISLWALDGTAEAVPFRNQFV